MYHSITLYTHNIIVFHIFGIITPCKPNRSEDVYVVYYVISSFVWAWLESSLNLFVYYIYFGCGRNAKWNLASLDTIGPARLNCEVSSFQRLLSTEMWHLKCGVLISKVSL